ncbi:hypothetical protein HQQ94_13525 [Shewanella sp. VB17]|uniref:hypothetical protein n=1 Tax=Shewanella sp. VB17 TaxID=2739432 RepID=UPI0015638F1A|nr:hypothetical protein [Shewanella sp. VB17]NRD74238.1 hypothetical protein [Shewanella sp. VB17]
MLTTTILAQDAEFETFAEHYKQASGNETSIEYFKRISMVRAFSDQKGEMIGGYTLNSRLPIRYFADIPASVDQPYFMTQGDDVVEAGGLWINSEVNNFYRGIIYLWSLLDIIKSKKRFIIGGAKHPKVAKLQSIVFPNKLYEGPIPTADYVCIFYAKRGYIPVQVLLIINKYWLIDPCKNVIRSIKSLYGKNGFGNS